jgi:hypothetical protein
MRLLILISVLFSAFANAEPSTVKYQILDESRFLDVAQSYRNVFQAGKVIDILSPEFEQTQTYCICSNYSYPPSGNADLTFKKIHSGSGDVFSATLAILNSSSPSFFYCNSDSHDPGLAEINAALQGFVKFE